VTAIFYGAGPAVIALILHSCCRLAKLGMDDPVQWAIAGVCLVVTVIPSAEVALLFIGAGEAIQWLTANIARAWGAISMLAAIGLTCSTATFAQNEDNQACEEEAQ
jgi:hypothetical protein